MKKTRVLIVDDSAIIRTLLTKIISSDPELEVVGSAPDPYVARDKLAELKPDVMTLDVEMPRMDGVTFLEKVMAHMPTRTIIISSLTSKGSETALRAMEAGAVDIMTKPAIDVSQSLGTIANEIVQRIKIVARAKLPVRAATPIVKSTVARPPTQALAKTTHQILAITASTGGTEALKVFLSMLPADIPGTVIVQHMPPVFTKTFADTLSRLCNFEVLEAKDGDRVMPGRALLAPGNYHMELVRSGAYYYVKLHQEPPLHGVRPAADFLFKSVAKIAGSNAIGVILTGMGKDGADGLLEMKKVGSYNVAQNEETCIVFGMPKVAIDVGAIHQVLPLDRIAGHVWDQVIKREVA